MASSSITPETTSWRCNTNYAIATLDYEVSNYLELKGMGIGKFVSSRVFRAGGYDWEIRFYPAGACSNCAGSASCYLRYLSQAKDVLARFSLTMIQTKGKEEVASFADAYDVFHPTRDTSGYHKFVDRSELKSKSRLGDGRFTIRCVLTVWNESPPLNLPDHLHRMLSDRRAADVTFRVAGEEFRAHSYLLAVRSPIFEAQLFGPMAEKDRKHVEVIDMDPAIFEIMLHYIYTDSLPPCNDDRGSYNAAVMQHLLVAADRYGLGMLQQMCEEELCKMMDAETVKTTLALANQHRCERLKKTCVAFMASAQVTMPLP